MTARLESWALRHRWWLASIAGLQALGTAGILIGSAHWLSEARRELARAKHDLLEVEQRLAAQRQQQDDLALREQLVQRLRQTGFAPSQWTERRLNVQQVAMSRTAARDVLADIARGPGKVFSAEQFNLDVSRPDEDLFTSPPASAAPALVTLSLRGRLFSREGR